MKKILSAFLISFVTLSAFAIEYKPLTNIEKQNMDNFIKENLTNKYLWVNKNGISPIGEKYKSETYYMRDFKNFDRVKVIGVSTGNADCKKAKKQLCTYKVAFQNDKDIIEIMPILTIYEPSEKKFDLFYSAIPDPSKDIQFTFFLEKDPLRE